MQGKRPEAHYKRSNTRSMEKKELEIVALSHSMSQSQNYAVILGEKEGTRRLPIIIGAFEAQAIAVAMEGMTPNRPLTHDLFKNALETFGITLREVVINNLLDGIFYALLVCEHEGVTYEIDSRTSDALALAVRFDCPIYTYEFILESAGVELEEAEQQGKPAVRKRGPRRSRSLSDLSLEELNERLQAVLEKEDYEEAARIRDEINRRKEQG